MCRFFKTVFVVGLCGVGVVATSWLVLGKERTQTAATTLQRMAQQEVDDLIRRQDNLIAELNTLRGEYPRRIALLKSQQADIERRLDAIEREETRARNVIRLCEEDICHLEDQRELLGLIYADERVIEHRGTRYNSDEAHVLAQRIGETRQVYLERIRELDRERMILEHEHEQIGLELLALEAERDEFELEYQSLVRELERIERNEQRLKQLERRQSFGVEGHGEAMRSLHDLKTALDRKRIEQEERMKVAGAARGSLEYEARARALEHQHARESKRLTDGSSETPIPAGRDAKKEEDEEPEESHT